MSSTFRLASDLLGSSLGFARGLLGVTLGFPRDLAGLAACLVTELLRYALVFSLGDFTGDFLGCVFDLSGYGCCLRDIPYMLVSVRTFTLQWEYFGQELVVVVVGVSLLCFWKGFHPKGEKETE